MKNKEEPYTKDPTTKELKEMNWNLQHLTNYLLSKKLEIRRISFQIDSWRILVGRGNDGFACKWILEVNEAGMRITPLHKQWSEDFDWHDMHKTLSKIFNV